MNNPILWNAKDSRKADSHMNQFWQFAAKKLQTPWNDWSTFHQWSIQKPTEFWYLLSEYLEIQWEVAPNKNAVFKKSEKHDFIGSQWFPGSRLSYAQNLVEAGNPDELAIIATHESRETRSISRRELKSHVKRLAGYFKSQGLKPNDRVFGVVSHNWEAAVAMLATNACGAVWASVSPDFGSAGIFDRMDQVNPKILVYVDSYRYNGKTFSTAEALDRVPESVWKIVIPDEPEKGSPRGDTCFTDILANPSWESNFAYEVTDFDHPLFILFSSGTTGRPKGLIHSVGRTLVQHKKELMLHTDLKFGERLFYFTTCGWMMWNWQLSALSLGACLVTYDGSPSYPTLSHLWDIIAEQKVDVWGTSPKFLSACESAGIKPQPMPHLKTILSTGSPLLPHNFAWVYEQVSSDIHLSSISGGTDILSCFMLGNPLLPVRSGEIQGPGLGMAVEAWDEEGHALIGQKGELVCRSPFVALPLGLLDDPKGDRYHKTYFAFYPQQTVWRHGDYIEVTPSGGIVVYGRSDATLNPGGVRIGTAEIYRQVETVPEILDSLAVGWGNPKTHDEDVLLFVQLRPGSTLSEDMKIQLKKTIAKGLTPRHVPREIFEVQGIPYTRSGKKVELLVRSILSGADKVSTESLANPQVLQDYWSVAHQLNVR